MIPLAILAGGLATRLRPLTQTIPKALVVVAGKPFICHQLEYLYEQGVRQVVLCVGYLGEMIESEIGDGSRFGLDVSYSPDGSALLGTGGALRQALPMLGRNFFVLYGDSFLPVDFRPVEKAFFASKKLALMSILENNGRWDKSNVDFRNGELLEYNKISPRPDMSFIDYGLSVLSSGAFDKYPDGQAFDLAELYQELSLDGHLAGYQVFKRFYEIGSHQGLAETEDYFLERGLE
jgi:N-acetyl-alpha-D-muramate 1-phosphate uridylyltransferase